MPWALQIIVQETGVVAGHSVEHISVLKPPWHTRKNVPLLPKIKRIDPDVFNQAVTSCEFLSPPQTAHFSTCVVSP